MAEKADIHAATLGKFGAVVINAHGLEESEPEVTRLREATVADVQSGWGELRMVLQRFWRSSANESIDVDDAATWPTAESLQPSWQRRHAYTLRGPYAPLGLRARRASAKWHRAEGAAQLVLQAFLDPSDPHSRCVHFGNDTHRYARLAVSEQWYWLPWLGPPEDTIGVRLQQQGWRTPVFPTTRQGVDNHATPSAETFSNERAWLAARSLLSHDAVTPGGAPNMAGSNPRPTLRHLATLPLPPGCLPRPAYTSPGRPGAVGLAGALGAATPAGAERTGHQGGGGAAPGSAVSGDLVPAERQVGWHATTSLASLISAEAPLHVQVESGAPLVSLRSHRAVARALRLAAEQGVPVGPGALEQAVRHWGQEREGTETGASSGHVVRVPVCLRSGEMLLTLGSTVRSLVWPVEPLPAMSRGAASVKEPATPLVWHEAQAWLPYRPERQPQTEPTAPEFQAYFEGLKGMQTHTDWLTGSAASPLWEGEDAQVAAAIELEAALLLDLLQAQAASAQATEDNRA